jgi:predicted ribosome quality control (RQC) complex YloA/Tae2 family protein
MQTLEQLQDTLETLQAQLVDAEAALLDIQQNPQDYADLKSEYDDYLDECYSDVCEALPVTVSGSQLIKDYSDTTYRCGFNDWLDSYDYTSLDAHRDAEEVIEDLEEQIAEVEQEIEALEDEASEE